MGQTKEWLERQYARGYFFIGDRHVCAQCFEDPSIQEFVRRSVVATECDYCHRHGAEGALVAARIDDVLSVIVDGLGAAYGDPNDEGVVWDEGRWQGRTLSTYEVLCDELWLSEGSGELFEDIERALGDREWCQKDYGWLRPEEALRYGWAAFCQTVKHRTRYFFSLPTEQDRFIGHDEILPAQMLDRLAQIVTETGLIGVLEPGTQVFRARTHNGVVPIGTAADLGTAPIAANVQANRMSAAGISMFYGALESETAAAETVGCADAGDSAMTTGTFEIAQPLAVLNLSNVPAIPSIFDLAKREIRPGLIFLHGFASDVAKPIERDNREHIEYVPTQIVTEYFRQAFALPGGERLAGVLYPSSKLAGGTCCVMFAEPGNAVLGARPPRKTAPSTRPARYGTACDPAKRGPTNC